MPEDRVIKAAFLISFTGHCLLFGAPGFNSRLPQHKKKLEELTVDLKIERPALLQRIDDMGPEKKFKDVEQISKLEPKPQILPEQVTVQQIPQERIEEKFDVINPEKDAMLRYQDMVKQRI